MCSNHKDCPRDSTSDLWCLCRPIAERSSLPMAVVEATTAIVRYANPAFCRLISKKGEELIGQPFAEMVPEGKACLAMLNRVYRTGGAETYTKPEHEKSDPNTWSYVMWPVPGGDQHPLGIMIQINETTLLQQQMAAMNESLLIAGIRQHELTEAAEKQNVQLQEEINERRRAEEALRLLTQTLEQRVAERTDLAETRARQLQSLAVELIEAEERERRRFAQLLHEDLQQIIAAARFQLQTFRQEMPAEPTLLRIEKLLEESIRKSRRITHELSPAMLEHSSLYSVLKWLTRHMDEQFGLQVALKLGAEQPPENHPLKVFTFRVMQELLHNVHIHSGVKIAEVELSQQNDMLVLTVSDQGRGFNPESLDSAVAKDGFGLLSLRERVDYIGGNMLIESAPGQGSKFILSIPVNSFQTEIPESSTHNPNQAPCAESAPTGASAFL
jgi:signal transduction histidine kinase